MSSDEKFVRHTPFREGEPSQASRDKDGEELLNQPDPKTPAKAELEPGQKWPPERAQPGSAQDQRGS